MKLQQQFSVLVPTQMVSIVQVKADPNPGSPKAGAALIPSAPEDNLGLPNQPSQPSLARKLFSHVVSILILLFMV